MPWMFINTGIFSIHMKTWACQYNWPLAEMQMNFRTGKIRLSPLLEKVNCQQQLDIRGGPVTPSHIILMFSHLKQKSRLCASCKIMCHHTAKQKNYIHSLFSQCTQWPTAKTAVIHNDSFSVCTALNAPYRMWTNHHSIYYFLTTSKLCGLIIHKCLVFQPRRTWNLNYP